MDVAGGVVPAELAAASRCQHVGMRMYGRKYFGNERTTFVIDSDGKVAQVLRKVKPAEHDELVLKALAEVGRPVV